MKKDTTIYRIKFQINRSEYQMYVSHLQQSELFGFIEIGQFVWDQHTQLVVDPSHEKLKSEFAGVESTLIPMHNVIRIDTVKQAGTAKIGELGENVTPFVKPIYTPKP